MTASSLPVIGPLPAWDEYERPTLPGSPATLRHSPARRVAYVVVAALIGLTGALGNALVVANLQVVQGQLGLTPMEASWLSVAYATVNVTANLLLVKFRQRYGVRLFAELSLSAYALLTLLHLFVDGFATAVLVRGASGLVAAATGTLAVMYLLQALPKNRLGQAVVIGLAIPQVATPIAWLLSPQLLDLGDWQTLYQFESGLALCSFAAVVCLKLPVSLHVDVMEWRDLVTWTLVVPGIGLLVAVLSQGLNAWWLDTVWLGWALIGAVVLIGLAVGYELRREKPLIQIDWLFAPTTLRFAAKCPRDAIPVDRAELRGCGSDAFSRHGCRPAEAVVRRDSERHAVRHRDQRAHVRPEKHGPADHGFDRVDCDRWIYGPRVQQPGQTT